MISADQSQQFVEQGYLTVTGLLDAEADIGSFRDAYARYLDALADIFMTEANPDLRANYSTHSFAERFAALLGCSGGSILQHLNPALGVFIRGYRRQQRLPSAQRPEFFHLMRNTRLLDTLECFLGPEIFVSPVYHLNLKLAPRHLKLAEPMMTGGLWHFVVGTTVWHTDASTLLPDAHRSRIINAWIPLTPATAENGCLLVAPGSHQWPADQDAIDRAAAIAVALPAAPGDVIFLDNKVLHAALPNRSADDFRWALNIRYLPTGEPTGRPFLPGFIGRSRLTPDRELHNPELWREMWRAALDFLSLHPPLFTKPSIAEARAITAHWHAITSNATDWLRLADKKRPQLVPPSPPAPKPCPRPPR